MKPLKTVSRSEANPQYLAGYLPDYKQTGWKLDPDGRHVTFTDGCSIGKLRLVGNPKQHIETFPVKQIKRVRLLRRADGYYCQFGVQAERQIEHVETGSVVGIDRGLKVFYTDSDGQTIENPRHYRACETKLKRLHRRVSRKQKKSKNRKKARQRLAKAYLKVQRQREDFARKTANALVSSHDLIAYEHLQIRNLVKNQKLAKSIHDAAWGQFLSLVKAYGIMHAHHSIRARTVLAVGSVSRKRFPPGRISVPPVGWCSTAMRMRPSISWQKH